MCMVTGRDARLWDTADPRRWSTYEVRRCLKFASGTVRDWKDEGKKTDQYFGSRHSSTVLPANRQGLQYGQTWERRQKLYLENRKPNNNDATLDQNCTTDSNQYAYCDKCDGFFRFFTDHVWQFRLLFTHLRHFRFCLSKLKSGRDFFALFTKIFGYLVGNKWINMIKCSRYCFGCLLIHDFFTVVYHKHDVTPLSLDRYFFLSLRCVIQNALKVLTGNKPRWDLSDFSKT